MNSESHVAVAGRSVACPFAVFETEVPSTFFSGLVGALRALLLGLVYFGEVLDSALEAW